MKFYFKFFHAWMDDIYRLVISIESYKKEAPVLIRINEMDLFALKLWNQSRNIFLVFRVIAFFMIVVLASMIMCLFRHVAFDSIHKNDLVEVSRYFDHNVIIDFAVKLQNSTLFHNSRTIFVKIRPSLFKISLFFVNILKIIPVFYLYDFDLLDALLSTSNL